MEKEKKKEHRADDSSFPFSVNRPGSGAVPCDLVLSSQGSSVLWLGRKQPNLCEHI